MTGCFVEAKGVALSVGATNKTKKLAMQPFKDSWTRRSPAAVILRAQSPQKSGLAPVGIGILSLPK